MIEGRAKVGLLSGFEKIAKGEVRKRAAKRGEILKSF
jgi:hypothetical protein